MLSLGEPTMILIDPEGYVCGIRRGEAPFKVIDTVIAKQVRLHKQKGTLNETPIRWDLELNKQQRTPLRFPGKVTVDSTGQRLIIADSGNHRLVITDPAGQKTTVIGSGRPGRQDGPLAAASFNDPQGMVLDGDTLYVADNLNHLIRKIDLKAGQVTTIAGTGKMLTSYAKLRRRSKTPTRYALSNPWDLALVNQRLYIAMAGTHQLVVLNLATNTIVPYSGNGTEDVRDGTLAKSCHAQPSGLASDGTWLFVADSEGASIRAVPLDPTQSVKTLVGTSRLPGGRLFAFGDVDGNTIDVTLPSGLTASREVPKTCLQHPLGVVFHDAKIYVADTYNNKIKVIDPAVPSCLTLVGTGEPGADDEPGRFDEPAGISYAAGKLYVADTNNHLIRTVDLKDANRVATLQIDGLTAPTQPKP